VSLKPAAAPQWGFENFFILMRGIAKLETTIMKKNEELRNQNQP
jgi:hypothetical protein